MERNVVSLETAKKLKAAGFPQKAAFWWGERPTYGDQPDEWQLWTDPWNRECYAAPTAQEIADQLPDEYGDEATGLAIIIWAWAKRHPNYTMAEALAVVWLKLNENKQ